ncbi:MAG: hypothetical protein ABR529_03850 [Actinomycetota bacterium]
MDRDEMITKLSKLDDEWTRMLEERRAHEPDWDPLEKVLPFEWCGAFMFMGYSGDVRLYKHGFTRRYLNLDAAGKPYRWTGRRYVPTSLEGALEHAFDGLEDMGETRTSVYDDEAIRRRYEALAQAGWKVVSLGPVESPS